MSLKNRYTYYYYSAKQEEFMKSVEKNKYKQKKVIIKGKLIVYTEQRYDKRDSYSDSKLVGEAYESEVIVVDE